jgi:hypothetical protein
MDTTVLLERLIDLERFIGVEPDAVIRRKLIDIEECILTMHEEATESLRRTKLAAEGDTARVWKVETAANGCRATTPYLVWSNPATLYRLPWPPPAA